MTTLTTSDWERLLGLLDAGWPGELTEDAATAYRTLLADVPPDHILDGLRRLLHSGQRFRPTAAEILGEARRDPSTPTFDEALILIFGRGGVLAARPPARGIWIGDSHRVATDAAASERMSQMHPLIEGFVHRQTFARLRRLDLNNDWHRKELRDAWHTYIHATDGRQVAALASRTTTGNGGLRRLDPLAGLSAPPPALNAGGTTPTDANA